MPPPIINFGANVLQWIIYDGYTEDFALQEAERERERLLKEKDKVPVGKHQTVAKKEEKRTISEAQKCRMFEAWRILERMINLNSYDDIAKGSASHRSNFVSYISIRLQILGGSGR